MSRTRTALSVELERRLCLRCGFRGRLLQGDRGLRTFTCPSCQCDLYARPPRSYAEMEGLVDAPEDAQALEFFWADDAADAPIEAAASAPAPAKRTFGPRLEITLVVCIVCAVGVVAIGRTLLGI